MPFFFEGMGKGELTREMAAVIFSRLSILLLHGVI